MHVNAFNYYIQSSSCSYVNVSSTYTFSYSKIHYHVANRLITITTAAISWLNGTS